MESIKKKIGSLKSKSTEKDAIIKAKLAELEAIRAERLEIEEDNKVVSKQVELLENDLDIADEQLVAVKKSLAEATEERDNLERNLKKVQSMGTMTGDQLDMQLEHLEEAQKIARESDCKFEEACCRLKVLEGDVERVDSDADSLELKNKELMEEGKILSGSLKSFKAMESSFDDKKVKGEDEIALLQEALEKSESEREAIMAQRNDLTAEVDDLEVELTKASSELAKIQQDHDETMQELNSLTA